MENKERMYLQALEHSSAGNISAAKELVEQILQQDPENSKASYLLGLIMFEHMNNTEKAMKLAQEAMKKDPSNPLGYYLYCDILIANSNFDELKMVTDGIEKLDSIDKAYIYHKLAYAYETRLQYTDAIKTLRKSKELETSENWGLFVNNEISRISRKYVRNMAMNFA